MPERVLRGNKRFGTNVVPPLAKATSGSERINDSPYGPGYDGEDPSINKNEDDGNAQDLGFRGSPALTAVVLNALSSGMEPELKLDLAPTISITNKVYRLNLQCSKLKPGKQVFMRIWNGHIKLYLGEFGPEDSVPLSDCCAEVLVKLH